MMPLRPEVTLQPLRVLILEDSARDAELVVRTLQDFGYEVRWTRVDSEEDFREHTERDLDLIIADYTLPQFDAPSALRILDERGLSVPFIIVTGTITEDTAISVLKQGADDFLLKDRLARLGPAVASAVEQRHLRNETERAENLLRRSEARFRRLVTRMSALVIELDQRGRILFVNETVRDVAGFEPNELLDRNAFELFFQEETHGQPDAAAQILTRGEDLRNYVTRGTTRDGRTIALEWTTANEYRVDGRLQKIVAFGLDITARVRAAERIQRLSRLYAAISRANEALIRGETPDHVFATICQACVEQGGFRLAWIGLADDDVRRIAVAHAYGPGVDYLEGITISTDGSDAFGRGPTGTAYRENRVCICNDMAGDVNFAPWRERAARSGFAASISLPICQGGKPIGALTVYGTEKGVFDDEAVALLQRMAENISFAMDQFKHELQRHSLEDQRAADALHMAELSRRVVAVQEDERRRLASELHDFTSPTLSAVALNLSMITEDVPAGGSPALEARLNDTRALLADAISGIREICSDLRPVTLDYAGLARALHEYAELFSRRTNIPVEVLCDDPDKRLARDTESALFRIAQEALTNCAKHAKASAIRVELAHANGEIRLSVSDNGAGFDPKTLGQSAHKPGLGLLTMRERAEFVGGKFTLESSCGTGTRLSVVI